MRYKIEQSKSKPGYWVCSDFINNIVCIFKDGSFNEDQVFEYLDDENKPNANELAEAVREMADWLREYHYCKILPCDIRLRIGQQIKSLRLANGWSLRDLEGRSGINNKNLSSIENGRYNIRLDTIEKLEEVFDIEFGFE